MAVTPLHFCGPKCSYCCLVISAWGIIMLLILGILFTNHSTALVRDAPSNTAASMDSAATSCFVAVAVYAVSMGISIWQIQMNNRAAAALSREY